MQLLTILVATFLVSLISFVGVFTLSLSRKRLERVLILLVGFAAGGMMGGAFLHLLPEALELASAGQVFLFTIAGFTFFLVLERYFFWRHCHDGICQVHAFTYLNLIGDSIHNFVDGLVLAASFMVDFRTGLITTLAVILHEIPQEIGDYGVLVYGGFKRSKALLFNFFVSLIALAGALVGYRIAESTAVFAQFLLPFTAGGFIYVASSDLIPEMQREKRAWRANASFVFFLLGIALIASARFLE